MASTQKQGPDPFAELRHSMTRDRVRDVLDKDFRNPITVNMQDSVASAFAILCNNDILGAPCVDFAGEYRGFVTMLDLVGFAADLADECGWEEDLSAQYWTNSRRFRTATVNTIVNRPRRRETHRSASVFHVLENLCEFGNQRQIALLDAGNRISGIVTQSMLIRYIHKNIRSLKGAEDTPVWKIRPFATVMTCQEMERAVDAFRAMADNNVTGLGISNEDGALTGVISIRDLRGIRPGSGSFRKLFDTVKSFKDSVKYERLATPWNPVSVNRHATLGDVLERMVNQELHRVFVVNPKTKIANDVITQSDVLRFICTELQK